MSTAFENVVVAETILQQLGGARFVRMTGAKHFVALEEASGLQFKLPNNFAKDGINTVRVILRRDDVYDVEYASVRGVSHKSVHKSEGLYFDDLQSDFTEVTGLYTSL